MCAHAWGHEDERWPFLPMILFASIFSAAYGASDEWHQAFVPGRYLDWRDWLVDIGGGTLGGVVYGGWVLFQQRMTVKVAL